MSDEVSYVIPVMTRRALGQRVLAVVSAGAVGDWAAYIDSVLGIQHDEEQKEVLRTGDKLPKEVACFLFPQFDPTRFRA